ncbi:hypothetical protein [Laspinema olomoucense]|uniref:hypothetical protein n=1 Tax=Laspinema olomoucense TaxID=3231600 RepID=UPI0021BAB518|nr:hypothetical protein [Laspinema sp. D3d]MCT7971094.1 hypothetical protein [Laspinema sp. D3d]
MPIYPPGNAGEKNGFPAYREYAENNRSVGQESIEIFPQTANREQRQIYIFNEGPGTIYLSYGIPATLLSPLRLPPGLGWLDTYDGGMAVNAISVSATSAIKAFIRSEGPITLPEPPQIISNIEEITDAPWVVSAPTQPSFQVFKALDEVANITILDPQDIMKNNSGLEVCLYVSGTYDSEDDLPYGAGGGFYLGSFPKNPETYENIAPFTFDWNTETGLYGFATPFFWIKTNLYITDYLWRYFAMKIIGPGLLEIVDYQTY